MTDLAKAVKTGIDNDFIKWADKFGQRITKLSTSQIRNIFGSVKKMEMQADMDLAQVLMLKPRIAYANKRNGLHGLGEELMAAIDAIDEGKTPEDKEIRFRRFCQGFEAILAYHRAHGGK
jgi:CRISPR-associated protein Csm2